MHKHHIIPKFLGGNDDPSNIECISAEDHFYRHYNEWMSTGDIRHLHSAKLLQKHHLQLTDEERSLICSKAGKIGGKVQVEKKIGIHSQTTEERKKMASRGGKNGSLQIECIIREGFTRNEAKKEHIKRQSLRGKRGGPKNKGFVWLNDGKKVLKYTKQMQDDMPVDEFIKQNPSFSIGRIKEIVICPYCGKNGTSYAAMCRYHFDKCKDKKNENKKNNQTTDERAYL